IVKIHCSHLKHLTGTFTVRSGDDGCMKIEKSTIVKKAMHRHGHVVTNAKNSSKGIGTRTQMGNLAKKLERMSFLLQRISFRIGRSINLNFICLNFYSLPFTQRLNQSSCNADTGSGGNWL